MHFVYCEIPLTRLEDTRCTASNDNHFAPSTPALSKAAAIRSNVRLMRGSKESDNTRFALSGKLSDVCAALDQLAAQETCNAWRCAF